MLKFDRTVKNFDQTVELRYSIKDLLGRADVEL